MGRSREFRQSGFDFLLGIKGITKVQAEGLGKSHGFREFLTSFTSLFSRLSRFFKLYFIATPPQHIAPVCSLFHLTHGAHPERVERCPARPKRLKTKPQRSLLGNLTSQLTQTTLDTFFSPNWSYPLNTLNPLVEKRLDLRKFRIQVTNNLFEFTAVHSTSNTLQWCDGQIIEVQV